MICTAAHRTLASMSEPAWTAHDLDADMSALPTGTVTLLLADIEGSTRLWETQPEIMTTAVERLDRTLADVIVAHRGVRPVEQGEGDSFVVAFPRAVDAVSCALALQRSALAPIKLRIGVHTGDVQLRDEGNYIGPTINRTARLRDLAHGGQTVLSGATELLVVDHLPVDVSLLDLGVHQLRDLPRPERVTQLCHPDLPTDFPPLRTPIATAAEHLPVQLTAFIGREREMDDIGEALSANRLVTLTGAGGTGKTRLAIEVAARIAADFACGAGYVDLAPLSDPDVVAVTTARALGLRDQPTQPAMSAVCRFVRDRQMLLVIDNCEHLLDASTELVNALLSASPGLTLLTTSREPLGLPGEVSWRVPSLSVTDEAVALFDDRARRNKPEFRVAADNLAAVTEICRRLDGLPLAIELAAARIRALSPTEIVDSLHDQFRLLTGGARTAVRRQQTLRASVDWSHDLLSDPERLVFRRLAVFSGGFDLEAAAAVVGDDSERYQVLDQLTLLVDKSLIVAEDGRRTTRYRMLETVRQYAQEKLRESRESDTTRDRHRDHYTATASLIETPTAADHRRRLDWAEAEFDNLRAAFTWSVEGGESARALDLASSLQRLWSTRGRIREGLHWLDTALNVEADAGTSPPSVRASVTRALLLSYLGSAEHSGYAFDTLDMARRHGDPALIARALTACGMTGASKDPELARSQFREAAELAEGLGDLWVLAQIKVWQTISGLIVGYPLGEVAAAAAEGLRLAEAIGDDFMHRQCRFAIAWSELLCGKITQAATEFATLYQESHASQDMMFAMYAAEVRSFALAYAGDAAGALEAADTALRHARTHFDHYEGAIHAAVGTAHLAAGDADSACDSFENGRALTGLDPQVASTLQWSPLAPLARGDFSRARSWADDIVAATTGVGRALALAARAYVAVGRADLDSAERDAHEALDVAISLEAHLVVPFALDCLAMTAGDRGNDLLSARLFGSADTICEHMGIVRFPVLAPDRQTRLVRCRERLGDNDFDAAYGEGAALSTQEALAYARRGRGERTRASCGWASLTRAERDVATLVSEGLGNKEVAARLFVSPRTVQSHLTHVYAKLGVTSRVQLAHEAASHVPSP